MNRNINQFAQIAIVCSLLAALLLPGCSTDDTAPVQSGTTAAPAAALTGSLADALASWQGGNKDEAVKEFVNIDWNKTTSLPKSFTLNRSKAEFMSLDESKQIQEMTKTLPEIEAIKKLGAYVVEIAPASADPQKYYSSVLKFADMLASQKDTMVPLGNIAENLKKAVQQAQSK